MSSGSLPTSLSDLDTSRLPHLPVFTVPRAHVSRLTRVHTDDTCGSVAHGLTRTHSPTLINIGEDRVSSIIIGPNSPCLLQRTTGDGRPPHPHPR